MKVYFISGLAADRRVFKYIHLPDGYEIDYLDWITPQQNENLQNYSLRLAEKINIHEPFVLVGLSMGGMVAVEIAKKYLPAATILISSIPVSAHLPGYFRMAGRLKLHKLLPIQMIKSAAIIKRLFTSERPEDKDMLKHIIHESDPRFIRWAVDAILAWNNESIPQHCIHIHGTRDEVLPVRFTKPTHLLPKAGHLLVMNRAKEINSIIENELLKVMN